MGYAKGVEKVQLRPSTRPDRRSVQVLVEDEMEFVYLAVRMPGWTDDGPQLLRT
jgi:hypothetical protein